jgi:ribonuclease P protein component
MAHGQAHRSDGVVLHWAPNGLAGNRYCIAAKTKAGGAVVRNRIRRWARELLRRWHPRLDPGYDIVVIARNREAAAGFAEFAGHLAHTLGRAGLAAERELTEDVR